ncbi:MAG: PAS domain-containing protein, partial [Alphaproteobacteria bacterium]
MRDNLIAQARADAIRKNGVPTLVANLVCGLSIAFIAARTPAPAWIVYSWIGALCVVLIGRYCLLRAYSSPALSRAPERWLRLHVSGTFIAGAIWAAGTVFLPYASGSDADLTILFVLVGIVAGGITSSVVYLPLMAAFVMPILAAVSIHFFLHRSVDGFVGGLLVFVFAAYAVRSARAFQNGFAEQVAMRVDNQRLVGQLEDAMARLEERKEYFRVIADYSFSWEIWFEADGSLRWVSPGVLGVTGYSQQEFYDRPSLAAEIIHEDDRERILRGMKVAALQPTTKEIEFRIRCKDGTERW